MSMLSKLSRTMNRWRFRFSDSNFVDFPKYREHGGYHWLSYETDEVYRNLVNFICSVPERPSSILDIGCGDGVYVGALALKGHRVHGIDGDYDATVIAKAELKSRNITNTRISHGPITILRNDVSLKSHFDLTYSMDVIEHLPDPVQLIETAVWCTKATGKVCIGTPLFRDTASVSPYHVREYTEDEFREILSPLVENLSIAKLPVRREKGIVIESGYIVALGTPRAVDSGPTN